MQKRHAHASPVSFPPPNQNANANQNQNAKPLPGIDSNPQDPAVRYRGWYPRWWLLSAIFCFFFVGMLALIQSLTCRVAVSGGLLCQINTSVGWQQGTIVALIWILFLFGWLIAYVFGVGTIEVTQQHRTAIVTIIRSISDFKIVYVILYLYSPLALLSIFITWHFNRFDPITFALSSMLLFLASACFLNNRGPLERRSYLLGYIVLAIICMIVLIWLGPFQLVMFTSEIIIILVCIVIYWRSRGLAVPQASLAANNAATVTPGRVFMSLLHSIRRGGAVQAQAQVNPAQAQAQAQANPTP